jgi:photosystem II stability/assembly factor-like uncharacterized protein
MSTIFLRFIAIFFLMGSQFEVEAQSNLFQPEPLVIHEGKASFRGISVVNDEIVWVSGSKGTVGLTTNGGITWNWLQVTGHEKIDFRDVAAMDSLTAIIMAVGEPAIMLRTMDGGKNWQQVFKDERVGMFLDAMHFRNKLEGMVIGDPMDRSPFIATTADGGISWQPYSLQLGSGEAILLDSGEAFFAASGSNLQVMNSGTLRNGFMVTGGKKSRLVHTDGKFIETLPLLPGGSSRGANSIAMKNSQQGIIVGGDFSNDSSQSNNCLLVDLRLVGLKDDQLFVRPAIPPGGYRSCVQYLYRKTWITCGTSGIDVTTDDGMHWRLLSRDSYHTLGYARKGKYVYLAGGGGRVGRIRVR